jgi:hypothetical protein
MPKTGAAILMFTYPSLNIKHESGWEPGNWRRLDKGERGVGRR